MDLWFGCTWRAKNMHTPSKSLYTGAQKDPLQSYNPVPMASNNPETDPEIIRICRRPRSTWNVVRQRLENARVEALAAASSQPTYTHHALASGRAVLPRSTALSNPLVPALAVVGLPPGGSGAPPFPDTTFSKTLRRLGIDIDNISQTDVEACPPLLGIQDDLLMLVSADKATLVNWRPSWFPSVDPLNPQGWFLYNPPNVVTVRSDGFDDDPPMFGRVMRREEHAPTNNHIKTWAQWRSYCQLQGVPEDFLCEDMIKLMYLALPI